MDNNYRWMKGMVASNMAISEKGKKRLLILAGIFVSCGIAIFAWEKYKMGCAIKCAEAYLSEKYEQKMEFLTISRNRATDWSYSLLYAPSDNEDLKFFVRLASDLKPVIREDGIFTYPSDGYLTARFSYNARQELLEMMPQIKTIGDLSVRSGGSIYGISALREDMSQQEMAELLSYNVRVSMEQLSEETKDMVAENIFELLQVVSKSIYHPDTVELFFDVDTVSGRNHYHLHDWEQFDSTAKLLEKFGA